MSKLHKRMVALGDLTNHTYSSIVASCGEPKSTKACVFTDIGEGTRSTWTDGVFSITLNFDKDGNYCGIYDHKNREPYIWLLVVTIFIVAGALIGGALMRKGLLDFDLSFPKESSSIAGRVIDSKDWYSSKTAGASFADLNGDGDPEFLSVDTEFGYVEELGGDYFGVCQVKVWEVGPKGLKCVSVLNPDGYCFTASMTNKDGHWYFVSGSKLWELVMSKGGEVDAVEVPDNNFSVTEGGEVHMFMENEAWINEKGNTDPNVREDIKRMAEPWEAEEQ